MNDNRPDLSTLDALDDAEPDSDEVEMLMLKQFSVPEDPRTTAFLTPRHVSILAKIISKQKYRRSGFRRELFENLLLLSRSQGGRGAGQMENVAIRKPRDTRRGFFSRLFGGNRDGRSEPPK